MKMKKLPIFLLNTLTLLLLFTSVCSQAPPPPPPSNIQQIHYVLRWPATYCKRNGVRCIQFPPLKFTSVGFWGTDANGAPYERCADNQLPGWPSQVFDAGRVAALSNIWPALLSSEVAITTWTNAWVNFGTCTRTRFPDPGAYFDKVVALANNMQDLLQDHLIRSNGIVPCDTVAYANTLILNSLSAVANRKVITFTCLPINNTHAYLDQVTFCYDNQANQFVNCQSRNPPCSTPSIIIPRPPVAPPPKRIPNTEFMKYVLQWPPTICMKPNMNCAKPIRQEFTLHGIWPANIKGYSTTNSQYNCGSRDPANWDTLFRPIEARLKIFWPTLRQGGRDSDIWKHEWREHGVCRGPNYQANAYFDAALRINGWFTQGNLINYLKTSGIIACDGLAFPGADIVMAVQKVFGNTINPPPNVYLTCMNLNATHDFLSEVALCTDKDGTAFTSCPSPEIHTTSCRPSKFIILPQYPRPRPRPVPSTLREPVPLLEADGEKDGTSFLE